ncbi:uncharacterized protein LTR77_007496 [Saxophila tyrrhenica]|uniref:BZIP domain-containing protein n=1 Tax=Saxophila tyrrhenica TaxID=1690608 RepID=A0AAV9P7U3_9PEZI|nr:hypothetical protein LTR77_007496 [Saxophila tyrrhenica]
MPRTRGASSQQQNSVADAAVHNQNFQPQEPLQFGDTMANFDSNPGAFSDFNGDEMDFSLVDGMFDENLDNGMFGQSNPSFPMNPNGFNQSVPNINPANISQFGPGTGGYPAWSVPQNPPSGQSNIVSQRSDNVRQHFGQITPPDDHTPLAKDDPATNTQQSQEDIAKLSRAQRARNAANKRHAKSKKRKDSPLNESKMEGEEEDEESKSSSVQREKNRIAAAKCRAKKKANSEEMQDVHRTGAKQNSQLHREVRELRDMKAFLRNQLLLHEPGVCQCSAIHHFNMAQAQQMAMGVGSMIPQSMSPSQGSVSSMPTPGSEMSGRRYSGSGSAGMSNAQPQQQMASLNFPHTMVPDAMHMPGLASYDLSSTPRYADFLQNSPGGQGGFS